MSDVPEEILREILLRLPVAPLLRFRRVSKSWKGLIDNQEFVKHHLNHSRKTSSNLNIILSGRYDLYSADFGLLDETNQANFQQLSHPFKTSFSGTDMPFDAMDILGSCDGLLVLRNHIDDETILWNPSVRSFHKIPCNDLEIPGYRDYTFYGFGFGYDFVSDDYKLISIVQSSGKEDTEFDSEVKLYSLKSDSWRTIQEFPYYIQPSVEKMDGVLANGALHWLVTGTEKWGSGGLVAAFDLGTEEYKLVPLPKFDDYYETPGFDVVVLGGCLSLVCYEGEEQIDLWVMKEYGVEESWSMLFSYDFCDGGFLMRPLAYSKCGRKVLLVVDNTVLRWYDLDKNSIDVPMVQMPVEESYEVYTCLQSLVVFKQERKEKKRSSRKRKYFQAKIRDRV